MQSHENMMNGFVTDTKSEADEQSCLHTGHSIFFFLLHKECLKEDKSFSMFHRAFFNSIIDKIPTHALFIQHYISLAC